MDYEHGLNTLRQLAQGTDWQADLILLDTRLRENLRDEGRFGSTEQTRSERARIINQLNALSFEKAKIYFSDLSMGKSPPEQKAEDTQSTSRLATDFKYDAFISYSQHDRDWVENILLPHLENAKVRVCLDSRDFAIGRPRLVNIEDAINRSRRTLLVMTPEWVANEFAGFETLLVQTQDPRGQLQRMLPLMLRPCTLPGRLAYLDSLDMTNPAQFEAQMKRLVSTIFSTKA